MGKSYRIVPFLVALAWLAGCGGNGSVNNPKPKTPPPTQAETGDLGKTLSQFTTCDKSDAEQPLPAEGSARKITVEDQIDNQDLELLDCDGKVTSKSHGPVRLLSKKISIPAPHGFKGKVNFIEIQNLRTCAMDRVEARSDREVKGDIKDLGNGQILKLGEADSIAGISGAMRLHLTDSTFKFASGTNVRDGNNVLMVQYLGKCLKYRKVKDEKATDVMNCEKAEVLGQQTVLLNVKVKRNEVPGVTKIPSCTGDAKK